MKTFQDRVVVVTGGASGIGLGMARAFAASGAKLVIADLDEPAMDAAVAELTAAGTDVVAQRTDVSNRDDVQALADLAVDTFGGVHVLCNNAGIGIPTPTKKIKLDDWRWIIDVDLWGPIYGVEIFLPIIEEQEEGHINATSSMAGLIATPMMAAYNVAKHGVVALMATLERELRHRDSTVTTSLLCPGPINTNISRHSVQFRPGQAKPAADGESAGKAAAGIQAILEKGMDPDEVGRLVRDSIADGKFWILTHPHWSKAVHKMLAAMDDDQTLSRA